MCHVDSVNPPSSDASSSKLAVGCVQHIHVDLNAGKDVLCEWLFESDCWPSTCTMPPSPGMTLALQM
jgi:hypothetical protein